MEPSKPSKGGAECEVFRYETGSVAEDVSLRSRPSEVRNLGTISSQFGRRIARNTESEVSRLPLPSVTAEQASLYFLVISERVACDKTNSTSMNGSSLPALAQVICPWGSITKVPCMGCLSKHP